MIHEKISYKEIKALGFNESKQHDEVYEAQYGFPYVIIEKKLTKKIYLDWEKHSQLCYLVRMDKDENIRKHVPVANLEVLKQIVNFFTDGSI